MISKKIMGEEMHAVGANEFTYYALVASELAEKEELADKIKEDNPDVELPEDFEQIVAVVVTLRRFILESFVHLQELEPTQWKALNGIIDLFTTKRAVDMNRRIYDYLITNGDDKRERGLLVNLESVILPAMDGGSEFVKTHETMMTAVPVVTIMLMQWNDNGEICTKECVFNTEIEQAVSMPILGRQSVQMRYEFI